MLPIETMESVLFRLETTAQSRTPRRVATVQLGPGDGEDINLKMHILPFE